MTKRASVLFISFLLLSTLLFQSLTLARVTAEGQETEYYVKSLVTYSNKGNTVWNFTERVGDRTIGLFMTNSWQTASLVNSTHTIETRENDTDGNEVAVLQLPEMLLNPGQNISIAVTYHVVSKSRTLDNINENASKSLNEIPLSLKEKYSGAEGPWLVNNTELRSLANNVTGDESNALIVIKNFVAWIAENIQYEIHEVPQYPNETLTSRRGDCDDQAILLITLSRIVGIPAFLQVGALYKLSQLNTSYWEDHVNVVQRNIGWHGWAIVYIPPWGWLPVDLTYVFGGLRGNPLNAITNAAVTRQSTIQYMNISRTDQVTSSQESRDFLQTNNFYMYIEDEMIDVTPPRNPLGESGEQLIPLILIIVVALSLASSYFVANRFRRKREKETNSSIDKY